MWACAIGRGSGGWVDRLGSSIGSNKLPKQMPTSLV
jgi:hypothetical protein